jgi:hypothetical protein
MSRLNSVVLLLAVVSGCSTSLQNDPDAGTSKSDLTEVTGIVTLDGKPLGNAVVRFEPVDGKKGTMSWGQTDSTGFYKLQKSNGMEGCHPGRFKVVVSKFARADGTPFPADIDGATAAAEGVEHVPSKYSDLEKTILTFEVPKEGKKINIELTSK